MRLSRTDNNKQGSERARSIVHLRSSPGPSPVRKNRGNIFLVFVFFFIFFLVYFLAWVPTQQDKLAQALGNRSDTLGNSLRSDSNL